MPRTQGEAREYRVRQEACQPKSSLLFREGGVGSCGTCYRDLFLQVLEPEQWEWSSVRHYARGERGPVLVNETQKAELRLTKSLDAIVRGAHPSKTAKGEAAKVVVGQGGHPARRSHDKKWH